MENEGAGGDRVVFSVVVPKELADRLTRLATARGAKRSQFARVLLAEGVDKHERVDRIAQAVEAAS